MTTFDRLFSAEDLERIRELVAATEAATATEIVAYVVEASDDYRGAVWKSGLLFSLLFGLLTGFYRIFDGLLGIHWVEVPPELVFLAAAAGALLGLLLGRASMAWRIGLTPASEISRRVERRAALAGVEERVFGTRDRSGILLFLSLLEHRVVVLSDSGVEGRVPAKLWEEVVDTVCGLVRGGRPVAGILAGIEAIGRGLGGEPVDPEERDELPDDLRRSER